MALNPPLTNTGDPCRVEGEFFVMKRKGVEFEFKVENGSKYSGEGSVILTTARMVCINKKTNSLFKAFDIPLALISNEKFEQPIFGANYIKGTVKPLFNLLPGNTNYKIWFSEGGFGTFVPAVFNLISSIKKNNYKGIDSKLLNSISTGTFSKTAYVDPNDPSVIYLEQPEIPGSSQNNQQQFGNNQQQFGNNQQQFVNQGYPGNTQPQYINPNTMNTNQQQQFYNNNQGFGNQGFVNTQQQTQFNQTQPIYNNQINQQPGLNQGFSNNQFNQGLNYNQQFPNNQFGQFQQNTNFNQQPQITGQEQYPNYNQQYSNFNQQQQPTNNNNSQFNQQYNNNLNQQPNFQQNSFGFNNSQGVQPNVNVSTMTTTNPPQINTNQSGQVQYPDLSQNTQQGGQTQFNSNFQQQQVPQQGQQIPQQPQQPQQPSNPKYFGFFGPELKKNN